MATQAMKMVLEPETDSPDANPTESIRQDTLELDARSEVEKLAYALWQARGCPDGSPEEDWLGAERELAARTQTETGSQGTTVQALRSSGAGAGD